MSVPSLLSEAGWVRAGERDRPGKAGRAGACRRTGPWAWAARVVAGARSAVSGGGAARDARAA
ncbi:hypothetical protein ACWC6I_29610 [Streptomyces sp. NPDC001414]